MGPRCLHPAVWLRVGAVTAPFGSTHFCDYVQGRGAGAKQVGYRGDTTVAAAVIFSPSKVSVKWMF